MTSLDTAIGVTTSAVNAEQVLQIGDLALALLVVADDINAAAPS